MQKIKVMKGYILVLFLFLCGTMAKAQYAELSKKIKLLEEKKAKLIENIDLNNRKFLLINDFENHTERNFLIFNEEKVTLVEIFDDKKTGESISKVYSGNMIKTQSGVISVYCDLLEGKKIALPTAKILLAYEQNKIIYLEDINTKERWIDEKSFGKK